MANVSSNLAAFDTQPEPFVSAQSRLGGAFLAPIQQATTSNYGTPVLRYINTNSGFGSAFAAPTTINFNIQTTDWSMSKVTKMYLELDILNPGSTAVTLGPAAAAIQQYQIWQSQTTAKWQLYPEMLVQEAEWPTNQSAFTSEAQSMGLSATTFLNDTTTLAAGATRRLYVPLWEPFSKTPIPVNALSGPVTFQFLMALNSQYCLTAGSTVTLNDIRLHIQGYLYDDPVDALLVARAAQNKEVFRVIYPRQQVIGPFSPSASGSYTVNIGNDNPCLAAFVRFYARPAGATAMQCYTPYAGSVGRVSYRVSGLDVIIETQTPSDLLLKQIQPRRWAGQLFSLLEEYEVDFTDRPQQCNELSLDLGSHFVSLSDNLFITTSSTFTPAAIELVVTSYQYCEIVLQDGVLSLVYL